MLERIRERLLATFGSLFWSPTIVSSPLKDQPKRPRRFVINLDDPNWRDQMGRILK